jgi:hypothetical protein
LFVFYNGWIIYKEKTRPLSVHIHNV